MNCRSELEQRTPTVTACVPLYGALGQETGTDPAESKASEFGAVSDEERRTKEKAG